MFGVDKVRNCNCVGLGGLVRLGTLDIKSFDEKGSWSKMNASVLEWRG